MEIVLPNLRLLKCEKGRHKNCHQDDIKRIIKPKFLQQTTFGTLFMEIAKKAGFWRAYPWKLPNFLVSKACVHFGLWYGNPERAEAVEK